MQAVVHEELKSLAADLELGGADHLTEDDALRLDQAALSLTEVNEALATIKEVRAKMGRPAVAPKPPRREPAGPKRQPKGKAKPSADLAKRKAKSRGSAGSWGIGLATESATPAAISLLARFT